MSEFAYVSANPPAQFRSPPDLALREPEAPAPAISPALAARLAGQFGEMDLFERVAAIRALIPGRIVFTTSFGLEAQALAHAIFSQELAIDAATLDTGRLFPETYDVWAETEQRYGIRIAAFVPEQRSVEALVARQGINGLRTSVAARLDCCAVRKVAPLARILDGSAAWITGMRADQSAERARLSPASFDPHRRLIKANPLFDWSRERTLEFVRTHEVPYNALHDRGYLSIGCAPCTRAVAPGQPERAGRWWWEQGQTKECGLHITNGRVLRASPPQV
jgi:phosphoadenosine phosphosulfate reductase